MKFKILVLWTLVGLLVSVSAANYQIDSVHSQVGFRIRHTINKIPGTFEGFTGTIQFDPANPEKSVAQAEIDIASVDTGNSRRDSHLQRDDFFHAVQYPKMTYLSTSWKVVGENRYEVKGNLTLMGKTLPVVLEVESLGSTEARGHTIAGWEASGKIDRTAWGVNGGQPLVGIDVEINLSIQARQQ
jgi:polyisoprenoid-binding protein YceI